MARPSRPASSEVTQRLCAHCGDPFIRGPRAIYCDSSCARQAATRAWRVRNPDLNKKRRREEGRKGYLKKRESVLKRHAEWREQNPEYSRRYHRNISYGSPDIETLNMTKDKYRVARDLGFRSGLEVGVAKNLESRGVKFEYETVKVKYTAPAKEHVYTPDYLLPNGVIIETKGRFTSEDRKKMRLVKEQNPELDIRLLFGNARNRINKGSPTTYAMWAEKNGYPWAEKVVPQEWIDAPRKN